MPISSRKKAGSTASSAWQLFIPTRATLSHYWRECRPLLSFWRCAILSSRETRQEERTLMAEKYILDEQGIAHLETDLDTRATWYESHNHIVAETALPLGSNTIHLRTWFLGVDYNHEQEGGSFPLLFETEVKVSSHIPQSILWQLNESNGTRYGTQDAARSGHSILEHNIREG